MVLTQGELFWGMDNDFVKNVMDKTHKVTASEGDILFKEGEAAWDFYILLKGRVKLSIGDNGPAVYIAKDPGQVVGWSTLLGREAYSATAQSLEASVLLKIGKQDFLRELQQVPSSEALLYKRLAVMLGERLIAVYPSVA